MQLEKLIKIHGIAFSILAYAVSLLSLTLINFNDKFSLIFLSVFIVVLGVPHGSFDTLFAKELFSLGKLKTWSIFTLNYLGLAALVVAFWLLLPTLFLLLFLLISIIHFSDDLIAGTPKLSRILYGGIIIFLPALLHAAELTRLYGYLIDAEHARLIVTASQFIAFAWLIALLLVVYPLGRLSLVSGLETGAVIVLSIFTPPLLAFTVYFCFMHSFRHLMRSNHYLTHCTKKIMMAALIMPTLIVVVLGYAAWNILPAPSIDAGIIKILFVTLAALTVPHMILLEKSGFSNWIKHG